MEPVVLFTTLGPHLAHLGKLMRELDHHQERRVGKTKPAASA
jgi:hypothetical protein